MVLRKVLQSRDQMGIHEVSHCATVNDYRHRGGAVCKVSLSSIRNSHEAVESKLSVPEEE